MSLSPKRENGTDEKSQQNGTESGWTPESWKKYPVKQIPEYKDKKALKRSLDRLKEYPGLVSSREIKRLRALLVEVHDGQRFLLQGGDCAEKFSDCNGSIIEKKLKILLQMSLILSWGGKIPTVRIGRMAGQYGKPRSSPWETLPSGEKVLSFKGENVNGIEEDNREFDPQRLVSGYFHSATTLNYLRMLLEGGFADLRHADHWELNYVNAKENRERYEKIVDKLMESLEFMDACRIPNVSEMSRVEFFTSHEGLLLPFEEAMTRKSRQDGKYYDLSAHFVWIGDRTRQLDGGHVEFMRGIQNPIGCKVGPTSDPNEIVEVVKKINPDNEKGKIVLITRFSAAKVKELLPNVIKCVKKANLNVVWQCDPMHGNTHKTSDGIKTRNFDTILSELVDTFNIHEKHGTHLGGVHFELTGDDVTECTGGPRDLKESELSQRYETYCDPRLNYQQSMEMAFKLSELLAKKQSTSPRPRKKQRIVGMGDLL